jgi:LysM repeat protein
MMKKLIYVLLFSVLTLPSFGQMKKNSAYLSYIDQYKDLAIEQMLRYGIPASITLSQGLLESRAGMSELAINGNNHFGIKCHDWNGKTIYHDDDAVGECFRAYSNARDSYEDHSKFLRNNQRYNQLFSYSRTDYRAWAYGLKAAGYATNPNYASQLINIIQLYNLDSFDALNSYDKFMVRRSADRRAESALPLHPIYIYNKNYYLYARQGDTFKSIGEEVGISYRKIAKYNERDRDDVLSKGDIIYLKKKQKHAMKTFKNHPHIVKDGDSMYSISQLYGVRVASLYKINNLPESYEIQVGDEIRVY